MTRSKEEKAEGIGEFHPHDSDTAPPGPGAVARSPIGRVDGPRRNHLLVFVSRKSRGSVPRAIHSPPHAQGWELENVLRPGTLPPASEAGLQSLTRPRGA